MPQPMRSAMSVQVFAATVAFVSGCSTGRPPSGPAAQEADSAAPSPAPRFSVEQRSGLWWLVDAARGSFFSLGVCVVDQGIPPGAYDPARPAYSAGRFHAGADEWARATLRRLRSWGFTTAGGWSDVGALASAGDMDLALTPVLGAGMEAGVPWFDLWDPKIVERVEQLVRERMALSRGESQVIGYYTDNEMGWWNGALWKLTLEHSAKSRQRQLLVKLLRETYSSDWQFLLRDFDPEGADGFAALEQNGMVFLRPGGDGIRVARRFLGLVAERYYELLTSLVRKNDPRALILGDRYQSFYYPEVARAAASHVDVVSTNLNAQFDDGSFCRFFLDTLHVLTRKPIIVSEIYMCSAENSSADPNNSGLFPVVATQQERGEAALKTISSLAALPYVVGADWFQYYDEPPGGRFDGENFNFGLIDIQNGEYQGLIRAIRSVSVTDLHARSSSSRLDASGGVPPAPINPLGDFTPNRALRRWDRERGFVPASSSSPMADLYFAWEPDALDFGLFALDAAEDAFYRDRRMTEEDRMEWTLQIDGLREPIRLRIGSGLPLRGKPDGVEAISISGKELTVRTVAAVRVPASRLGRVNFQSGDEVSITAVLTTHARAYRVDWSGKMRLSR